MTQTRKIAAIAESFHCAVVTHNFLGPVLTAAAVHLDTVIPNFVVQEYILGDEDRKWSGFSGVLRRQKERGVERKLMGFEMTNRGIPRHGYPLRVGSREVGQVTSGTFAPFLKKSIGLGYVSAEAARIGQEIEVLIRGSAVPGRIIRTPFYKRPS